MRSVGCLSDGEGRERVAAFFAGHGVAVSIDAEGDTPEVWVLDEDAVPEAGRLLAVYREDDSADAVIVAVAKGEKARLTASSPSDSRYRVKTRQDAFKSAVFSRVPVTFALLFSALLVALLSDFGKAGAVLQPLLIEPLPANGEWFAAVRAGQIWRLFSPILIHFGLLHLLFNMLWLRDLGTMLEASLGKWRFALMVAVLAAVPNACEYLFGCGANFGGMSGVVYGLLSYAYVRGRRDLTSGVFVAPQTAVMMGIWFLLCLFNVMPNVANVVHGVGLLIGAAWGWWDARGK